MKNKTIVITGGAGFIGSHLCEALCNDNIIISIDNYFTGSKRNHVRHKNITYLNGNASEIKYLIHHDIKVDFVFHLGEYSRVEQSFEDSDLVFEYNMGGIVGVLEFCRSTGAKLLYAGSSTKFGDNGHTSSPYAWTKATNTELVKQYAKWFGIDFRITYFYNVYGPREISEGKYSTLIAKFHKKILNGEKLTVTSPGTQLRNFTHINDIISGLLLVAEKGSGDGYCIGADEAYTVLDIAKLFGGEIVMTPAKEGNRMIASVLNQKMKSLGWSTKHNVKDYISQLEK